jgi:hypothetical protein
MTDDIPGGATQGVNRYSGPDYTSVPKPWLEEQLAEIRRLQAEIDRLRCEVVAAKGLTRFWQVISEGNAAEIQRLRARVAELETGAAITFGTLEQPTDDEPAVITHGHAPSAPPHNERPPIGNDDE